MWCKIVTTLLTFCLFFSVSATEYLIKIDENFDKTNLSYEKIAKDVILVRDENKFAQQNIKMLSGVLHIEENQEWHLLEHEIKDTDYYDRMWGLHGSAGVQAEEAWTKTTGSTELVIAVIDTGIDYRHKDLKENLWQDTEGNFGYNAITDELDPMDGHGHGTHCAGTIGALHNDFGVKGVMADVRMMGVKFLSDSGSGTTADAIKAIDYARENGAHIMSNSWGGGGYSELLKEAIQRASDENILFVAAAGNSRRDNDARPSYPASYNVENVVSVASHTSSDRLSFFSSYGAESVHVSAPGSSIWSTWTDNGYRSISGTSMATPHVSGIAGLMLSLDRELSVKDLKQGLIDSCVKGSSYEEKVACNGRVSALNALE
jgi:thermitase